MTIKELHEKSMEFVDKAIIARHRIAYGPERSLMMRTNYDSASIWAEKITDKAKEEDIPEPSRTIYHRSAATCLFRAGLWWRAKDVALAGISGKSPAREIALLNQIIKACNQVESRHKHQWAPSVRTGNLCFCDYDDDSDSWDGDCGIKWCLENGTPFEHNMIFCPRCGRILADSPYIDDYEEEEEEKEDAE